MKNKSRKEIILHPLLSFLVIILILVIMRITPLWDYSGYVVAVLFIYLPTFFERDNEVLAFNLSFSILKKSLPLILLLCLTLYPIAIAFIFLTQKIFNLEVEFKIPPRPTETLLSHIFAVAIPEELFFRGFLQGRLNQIFEKKFTFKGTSFGYGLFISNLLFAISHLVAFLHPFRIAVFFPGIIFGYLRERYSSILPPAIFHALSNVLLAFILK